MSTRFVTPDTEEYSNEFFRTIDLEPKKEYEVLGVVNMCNTRMFNTKLFVIENETRHRGQYNTTLFR
jgi:hypothetical protein